MKEPSKCSCRCGKKRLLASALMLVVAALAIVAVIIAAVAVSIKILDSISDMENLGYKLIAFVTAFAAFVTALTIAQHFWKNGMSRKNLSAR